MSQPSLLPQLIDGRQATCAYADLLFAFGFARLGDAVTATHLRAAAARQFDAIATHREFHRLARMAFESRIAEALRGDPHAGTLDDRCPEVIAALLTDDMTTPANSPTGLLAYALGRLIDHSTVLEPLRRFEPYRRALLTWGQPGPYWSPRVPPSDEWEPLIESADSPQQLWEGIRHVTKDSDAGSLKLGDSGSVYRYFGTLPGVLTASSRSPFPTVRRVVNVVTGELPVTINSFNTAPFFSRIHFAVVDALVLAIAGSGPLLPEADRPERLELLHSIRPLVMRWVEAIP